MAIIRIRRKINAGAGIGASGVRSFKRSYNIESDTHSELRSLILADLRLPKYGAPHPEDPACTCADIELEQLEDNPFMWRMDARWETAHAQGRNETEDQKQPDQRRPKWSKRFTPIPNYLPRDLAGKLFCDSAGTPFDPPPEHPIWVQEVTIARYETAWNDTRDLSYMYATNTDTWRGSAAGEALIGDISCSEEWLMGGYWFLYTWKVLQNPKIVLPGSGGTIGGWDPLLIIDAGTKYKNGQMIGGKEQLLADGRRRLRRWPAVLPRRHRPSQGGGD